MGFTFYGMNLVKSIKMAEYKVVQVGISAMKNDKAEKRRAEEMCVWLHKE